MTASMATSSPAAQLQHALADLKIVLNKAQLRAAIMRVDDDESGTLRYRECAGHTLLFPPN